MEIREYQKLSWSSLGAQRRLEDASNRPSTQSRHRAVDDGDDYEAGKRLVRPGTAEGLPGLIYNISTKSEAQAWAREQEARIDQRQAPVDLRRLRAVTLGDVLRRYLEEVTPRKRSAESERLRLTKLLRDPLCDLPLADLTPAALRLTGTVVWQ